MSPRQRATQRRRRRRRNNNIAAFAILAATAAILIWCTGKASGNNVDTLSRNSTGLSSQQLQQVIAPDDPDRVMVEYTGFTVAFNTAKHIPDYVTWELTPDKASGSLKRGNFATDPYTIGSADPADYKRSGFDRGHLAPAADMKWDAQAMHDCFLMTNIAPQTPYLNQHPWNVLEKRCRQRTRVDSLLIIVAGPVPTDKPLTHIGANRIPVPQQYFKVILSPTANPPVAIGFIMDNAAGPQGLQESATTVDRVEEITGYDFFSALPDDIEQQVESTVSFHNWNNGK